QKVGKIRKVLYFENEIEHKILVTYVIAKVSIFILYIVQVQSKTNYPKKFLCLRRSKAFGRDLRKKAKSSRTNWHSRC
ncbi:TPA: hypothetical protein ACJJEM_001031, partial [Neisseria meningitidis]